MSALSDNDFELPRQSCLEDDEPTYSITLNGVTTVTNDATMLMYVFKGSSDVTSTTTSGSMSRTNGPPAVVTLKKLTALLGGQTYRVTMYATMDGQVQGRAFWLDVKRNSGK